TANSKQQTANSKQQTANSKQQTANSKRYYILLLFTNVITLIFLLIVAFRYQVPQKVLNKLGIMDFPISNIFPGYSTKNIESLTYDRDKFDIVMLGDSITNLVNWNEILHNKGIANLGIGGDSTEGVLNRLSDVYLLNPKMCFVMIGINDFQGNRSVEDVIQNYRKIVQEIKQHNIKVIIQSVLHLGENYYINHIGGKDKKDWKKINGKVKRLNEELKIIAKEYDVEFIDINASLSANNILETPYGDESGLHLSLLGHQKWAEIIRSMLIE
ncbi:MAG: GDSL-type esterase/lipase family protein, partial [Treponema sp.]|nr:GDSL-type esterase/lipase family protein [Treponema sp.]